MKRNLTTADIEHIIREAQRERSRVLGEYLSQGFHAVGRALAALLDASARTIALRSAQSPDAVRVRLREFERNSA